MEITAILDHLIPTRSVTCRRRPSDPWFDQDCRLSKRRVRLLERKSRRTNPADACAATAAAAAWTAERRAHRSLLRLKRETFWRNKVDTERSSPRKLWKSVDLLMGRGRVPLSTAVDAATLHRFFDAKVADVRASTADAPPPTFTPVRLGCGLVDFRPITADDIVAAVRALPDKQCASDPMLTRLLKDTIDVLALFCVELFNRSLIFGTVPSHFKTAYITPLLKRPISTRRI